jgi:hypothetical protein
MHIEIAALAPFVMLITLTVCAMHEMLRPRAVRADTYRRTVLPRLSLEDRPVTLRATPTNRIAP